jgi:hypothetical protein
LAQRFILAERHECCGALSRYRDGQSPKTIFSAAASNVEAVQYGTDRGRTWGVAQDYCAIYLFQAIGGISA